MKKRVLRWWSYFRRGHNTYLAFAVSFLNFIVIQYKLLFEPLLGVDFLLFAVVMTAVYFPVAVLVGWYDYRRFAFPVEASIIASRNPWNRDLARALYYASRGDSEKVREILGRWVDLDE